MSANPKTIGVIGLGSIGMRHAKNLLAMGHKVFGQDTDSKQMDGLTALGGIKIPPGFQMPPSIRGMDGVVVASPTKFHLFHWATTVGPIFVEKPIAQVEDVDVVRQELEARENEITMVGNNLRFHSCVKWAKQSLELIGDPFWASFTVSQKNTKYTDPVLLNWGAHEIDLALHLLGRPAQVLSAVGDSTNIDVVLQQNGLHTTIHCDYLAPVERRGFCILGDKGNIGVDLTNRVGWIGTSDGYLSTFLPMESESGKTADSWDQDYIDEMQAFIDLIDGKPVPHAATGQDGLATLELILEAQNMAGIQ